MENAVKKVVIDTGNLLASEAFKRKVILLPSGEVSGLICFMKSERYEY